MAAQRRTPSQILGFRGGFLDKVKSLLKPEEKGGVNKVRGWGGGQMSSSRQTEQRRQIQGLERDWHIRCGWGGGGKWRGKGCRGKGEKWRWKGRAGDWSQLALWTTWKNYNLNPEGWRSHYRVLSRRLTSPACVIRKVLQMNSQGEGRKQRPDGNLLQYSGSEMRGLDWHGDQCGGNGEGQEQVKQDHT